MNSREFGQSGINLSSVTFGSMRLDPKRIEFEKAVELIAYLYESGVNTFHSSHEYESDRFFCRVIQQFLAHHPQAEIVHIAKIGVPHFDETKFNGDRLIALVEDRLQQLNTERIDLIQWLVRHQPNEDHYRLPILVECQQELEQTWLKLQKEGKVGVIASFPYSIPFADAVLKFSTCKGLVTYLNLLELEMTPFLEQMENTGQGYVAIRPLCGGLITTENLENLTQSAVSNENSVDQLQAMINMLDISPTELTKLAIQFPLLHPAVASVMVSVTNIKHAAEVIAAADVKSDRNTFNKILKIAKSTGSNSSSD